MCFNSSMVFQILLIILTSLQNFQTGFATDIEVLNQLVDSSLGYDVLLPELFCHAKYKGYHEVTWHKDGMVIKNSSADIPGHMLFVGSLLSKSFPNPLNLQGYYWCETDLSHTKSPPNKYLFRVENVHTYVVTILAKNDYFQNDTGSIDEKVHEKSLLYEDELQHIFFYFLPKPSVFVTEVKETRKGLMIKFFLYVAETFTSHVSLSSKLVEDKENLKMVFLELQNQPQDNDMQNEYHSRWKNQFGISLVDMEMYSTVACYSEPTYFPNKSITWPFAAIEEIVVPIEGCSTLDGLAVTRMCMGSFTEGAKWGPTQGVCKMEPDPLTLNLMKLNMKFFEQDPSITVKQLEILTDSPKQLKTIDLHFVSGALQFISGKRLVQSGVEGIFTIMNNILHANKSNMEAAKKTLRLSRRIIGAIENVVQLSTADFKDTVVSKSEIIVKTKDVEVEGSMVVGAAMLSPTEQSIRMSTSSTFLKNNSRIPPAHSLAGFVLPTELILKRFSMLSHPCKLNAVFFQDWTLFPDPKGIIKHAITKVVSTPVIYVGISGGPAWNLSSPVQIFFESSLHVDEKSPICVYFDKNMNNGLGGWATEGCYFAGLEKGFYVCHCHHLSTFSILLSENTNYSLAQVGISIYTSCGISICTLFPIIILFAISKIWRSNVDHFIFFYLGLGLLCSFVFLLLHGVESAWRPGCMFLSVLFYYFVQAAFCWSLILAISHYLRLGRNSDACETPNFLIRSAIFAWDLPLLIVGLVWVVKGSDYYEHKICWLTMTKISTIVCYPIIILLIFTMAFYGFTTYTVTCRHKKQADFFGKEQKENIIKFRISCSIFIFFTLAWIFGYLTLHRKLIEFKILFGISAIVTSIYILLFFVFNDASARQLLLKEPKQRNSKTDSTSTDAIACDVKTYNAT